ncbi:F-box protein SKIP23-like [Vitis riparia]|uniref:F-box protein SKIP23-like n=1 Tax=Vitis riparia TaxID=96939 RepID=UPI00155B2EAB|nr:F-box protein SKIP23-like [Vitis riparia]
MADWSQLHPELLDFIAKKFKIYTDYVRFRAVCHNWRASVPKTPHHLPTQLPWLMLPQSQPHHTHRPFFSLSLNKFHFLHLPEASHRRRRRGSSHGWLLILDEAPEIFLLNPLTRSKVHLPPLSTFPNVVRFNFADVGREYALRTSSGNVYTRSLKKMRDSFIKKTILSSSPANGSDFIAVVILNQTGDLALCRKSDDSWTFLEDAQSYSEDVIFHRGLFYAVNKYGSIAVCDVSGSSPRVSIIEMPQQFGGDLQYLVESGEELLLVTRYLDLTYDVEPDQTSLIYRTTRFQVCRLDSKAPRWEVVSSLGDRALFLGENLSLSLSSVDFPGCKGNCIYYTDDYSEDNYDGIGGEQDLGIFNLEDGSIEPLPCSHFRIRWPPPLWVTPNPC